MDLAFNVAQLMKEPMGAHRSYDFAEPELLLSEPIAPDDAALAARDIAGHARLTRLNARLRVEGAVRAAVTLTCSRCLEEFTTVVQAPLDEIYLQTFDVSSGLPLPPEAGEDDADNFTIDRNHIVDLTEAVRQVLLVNLPFQPVCRAGCRGLCPQCGRNLNEGACDCRPQPADPRLAALANLLDDELTAERFSKN